MGVHDCIGQFREVTVAGLSRIIEAAGYNPAHVTIDCAVDAGHMVRAMYAAPGKLVPEDDEDDGDEVLYYGDHRDYDPNARF